MSNDMKAGIHYSTGLSVDAARRRRLWPPRRRRRSVRGKLLVECLLLRVRDGEVRDKATLRLSRVFRDNDTVALVVVKQKY
jgi:hypothetical protein